ncbi:MAG: VanZ family protein [Myxococcota bacterium]
MGVWLDWLIGDMDCRTRYRIYLGARKAAHVVEYAILALLTFRAALITAHRRRSATACSAALFIVATSRAPTRRARPSRTHARAVPGTY